MRIRFVTALAVGACFAGLQAPASAETEPTTAADAAPSAPPEQPVTFLAGRPGIGFANPWPYDTAARTPAVMCDVTAGDNQYPVPYSLDEKSVNFPACCQAGPGYDMATGLGIPRFDALAKKVTGTRESDAP